MFFLHFESEAKSSYSGFWSRSRSLISVVGSETSKINWSESTVSNFHTCAHIPKLMEEKIGVKKGQTEGR